MAFPPDNVIWSGGVGLAAIQLAKLSNAKVIAAVGSDEKETNLYVGKGINETTWKPLSWTKQKTDKVLGGEYVYKSRDSIESMVYPTARIIKDLSTTGVEIFVDDAQFFNHEENVSSLVIENFGGLIVNNTSPEAAKITSTVSAGGTVQGLTIVSGGSGYVGATTSGPECTT